VTVSLEKVGDAKLNLGDKFGAIAAFEESLAMRRTLADRDKDNARRQWDVLLSLKRVGNARLNADDTCGALPAFEESLAIARNLLQENTTLSIGAVLRKLLSLSFPTLIAATRLPLPRGSAFLGRLSARVRAGVQGLHDAETMRLALKQLLFGPSTSHNAASPDGGIGTIPKRNEPMESDSRRASFQHEGPTQEHSTVLAPIGKETTANESLAASASSTGSIDERQTTTSVTASMVTGGGFNHPGQNTVT
jgi:hypothetical protein